MKRLLLILVCLVVVSGCSYNAEFVKGVDGYVEVIGPEYKKYIQNDPTLTKEDKEIRLNSMLGLERLVHDAKKQLKKQK